ncbi:MAG TPA: ABC transporter permease [Thermomicrobiales bacterium]|nr:ABC transporter permease [Thermomicrobiales bacterium]
MSTSAAAVAQGERRQTDIVALLGRLAPLIFLLALVIAMSFVSPGFRDPKNLLQVVRTQSFVGILAVGMTFVILTAGIDLSVGSLVAFAGLVCASAARGSRDLLMGVTDPGGVHVLYGFLAAIGVGLAIGLLQGVLIGNLGLPAFIVTLGGFGAWRGAALVWSGGQPISGFSDDFKFWGQGYIGPAPVPVVIFFLLVVIAHIVLRYTQYGRWIYAIGGNLEASRLSGLPVKALIVSVYVITGLCSGLSAFLLTSRLGSAEQRAGVNYELLAIAGVVIGGTSLFGGQGGVLGTLVGVLLIGVLNNALVILNVPTDFQPIIIGAIIVLSVYLDNVAKQRRR